MGRIELGRATGDLTGSEAVVARVAVRGYPATHTPHADAGIAGDLDRRGAIQLWLGWKSFPALDEWHKDVWAKKEKHHLLEVLFPPAEAHIYLGY